MRPSLLAHRLSTKRPLRLLTRVLAVSFAAMVGIGVAYMPRESPATSTESRYAGLVAHRSVRADVRGEPQPLSVVQGATAAPPTSGPVRYSAPVARIRISRIRVDAPIEAMGLTPDGTMESPRGPAVVAWYSFTPKPGVGGNAVLSGHVDYVNHGAAVFWDLRKLQPDDAIEVVLTDGTVLQYAITASHLFPLGEFPMRDVLAPTATESLTIITCGGSFSAGSYTHRLVLRAVRTGVVPA